VVKINMNNIKRIKKVSSLLSQKQKSDLVKLFFLMLFAYFLETASIGSIIPMLVFLSDSQNLQQYQFLTNFEFLNNLSQIEQLKFYVFLFLGIFIFKNLYLIFFRWYQINFSTNLNINLSVRLYKKYLLQPYLFFVRNSSSKLIRNVMIETGKLSSNVINSFTNLILELLILISLSAILFYYNPKGFALVAAICLLTGFIFFAATKKRISAWSKQRLVYDAKVINKLQTGFNLSKLIKTFLKVTNFDTLYQFSVKKLLYTVRNITILGKLPKHIFEIVGVISMTILVLYFIFIKKEFSEIIVLIGLFAAAAYRIFPAVINIILSIQNIQFCLPTIDTLISEFNRSTGEIKNTNKSDNNIVFRKNINLKNISFKYPNNKFNTLDKINLNINKNEIVGIAGVSGSGKTTLIDIILGVLKQNGGSFKIDGKIFRKNQRNNWNKLIGYVPQGVYLIDDSIEKNIAFGIEEKEIDSKKVILAAKKAQLHDFVQSLRKKYKTIIGESGSKLSEGQKQRISIARALYHNPDILIFDEVTSSLDTNTERRFLSSIKSFKNKKTIIMIAHRYSILKFCEKVYFFDLNKNFKKIEKKYLRYIS